jgi:hypothetical protein
MINQRTVALYGWISLGILLVLLVLVWTDLVGPEMRIPVLILAGILVASRVVMRILAARGHAQKTEGGE